MSHLSFKPLQVALLFDNAAQFSDAFPDWTVLADAINANFGDGGPNFGILPGATNDTFATFSNGDLHITLERMETPLDLKGFGPVLAQPIYTTMQPELVEGVKAHQRAILINVGLGNVPFPIEHQLISKLDMAEALVGKQDQARFERRLLVAQAASVAFFDHFTPTVVHWGQSDQLFAGTVFKKIAGNGFSMPLYVHPGFSSSGRKVSGSYCTGVNAYGSEHMIGKHVIFAEHHQNMATSYQAVIAFLLYCRSLGRVLQDGETFGLDENSAPIQVRHMPPNNAHPNGFIELRQQDDSDAPVRTTKRSRRVSPDVIAKALHGWRKARSGQDRPGRRSGTQKKQGRTGTALRPLFRKVALLGFFYVMIVSGSTLLIGNIKVDLSVRDMGDVLSAAMAKKPAIIDDQFELENVTATQATQ